MRDTSVNGLAKDMKTWGRRAVLRVKRLTKKYGVLCDKNVFSIGTKG